MVYGLGMLESGVTIDFGQLVMDNEFAGMIKHVLKGIPVDDENLAVDIIHDVGPLKDFLAQRHTLKHMRSQSQPTLINRRNREDWEADGSKDIYQRSLEEARHILETHKPDPLPDAVLATMRSIVEEAEEELGVPKKSSK